MPMGCWFASERTFHDIGKMFKPEYFIENQSGGHQSARFALQPAMSTLVIIAHVKDGADLARDATDLPEPIIDLILQHHGTTLGGILLSGSGASK